MATDLTERLTAVVPSPRQLKWQQMEYYNFIHFGINTFYRKEWSDGTLSPSRFFPKQLDTDQWVQALLASGSKGVILTVKHHDGFCLYPSKYTEYSIKNSPYKNGCGDIVGELAASCKKYGLKLGIYLSPWDRHEPSYGSEAYNDYFAGQLEELMSNYGEIFTVWFDGACGETDPAKRQAYDFSRFYEIIRRLQPEAVIAISGPDVRWIGNEGGHVRPSEWSVVSNKLCNYEEVAKLSQQSDDAKFMNKPMLGAVEDLGSRELLAQEPNLCWYPAEMDVSITSSCWFWQKGVELFQTRKAPELMALYYSAVGHNASFLLNVPVNRSGLIPKKFVKRLAEFGALKTEAFAHPVPVIRQSREEERYELGFVLSKVTKVVLGEDLTHSQRVEQYVLSTIIDGQESVIKQGTTIGYKEICMTDVQTDNLILEIKRCRGESYLSKFEAYTV